MAEFLSDPKDSSRTVERERKGAQSLVNASVTTSVNTSVNASVNVNTSEGMSEQGGVCFSGSRQANPSQHMNTQVDASERKSLQRSCVNKRQRNTSDYIGRLKSIK